MRDIRVPAFWKTWLFFALAGPLFGLLFFVIISLVVDAWGPVIDRLDALIPHAQDPSCGGPYSGHFELRCFQRPPDLRQFSYPVGPGHWQDLPFLFVGTYVICFIPAFVSGLLIGVFGFVMGRVRFAYAILVGGLVGLATGLAAIYKLENAVGLFFVCLLSTVVCWLATERWWRPSEIAGSHSAGSTARLSE